ncbi:hypothetical protein [Phytobacter sp. V91]|uniref:hypothetical protein n=1 Tax=Phytobacter sp. V91 TaxID=3369425 RepID=UPI003F5EA998
MKTAAKLSVLTSGVLLLAACDSLDPESTKSEFWYSNPTSQTLTFKVDDKDYSLEPGKAGSLKLSPGMHKMQNAKGMQQSFMVYENNSGGIINPDNHIYYMLSEVYAVEGKGNSFKPTLYDVTINGHELQIPLRSTNAVVIDHNMFRCSYPLGEPFPSEITTRDRKATGNIKTKCFDKPELLTYIASEYSQKLDPATPEDATKDSINLTFNYEIPEPAFKDSETQKQATKLTDLLKQVQASDDADIHDKLNKDMHQATSDIVSAAVKTMSTSSVADNEYYNEFIKQTGEYRAYGVILK